MSQVLWEDSQKAETGTRPQAMMSFFPDGEVDSNGNPKYAPENTPSFIVQPWARATMIVIVLDRETGIKDSAEFVVTAS